MENVTRTNPAKEEGFSLLEMSASLAILLLIAGVAFTALKSYQNAYYSQQMQADVHQDLRGAMELMSQEIGQAGLVPIPATLPTLSSSGDVQRHRSSRHGQQRDVLLPGRIRCGGHRFRAGNRSTLRP